MPPTDTRPDSCSKPTTDGLQQVCQRLHRLEALGQTILNRLEGMLSSGRIVLENPPEKVTAHKTQTPCANDANVGVFRSPLLDEEPIDFTAAAKLIPLPKPPHAASVARWCTTGVSGIRLEFTYVANRRVTSKQAVQRFLDACRKQRFAGMAGGYYLEQAMKRLDDQRDQVDEGSAGGNGGRRAKRRKIDRKDPTSVR